MTEVSMPDQVRAFAWKVAKETGSPEQTQAAVDRAVVVALQEAYFDAVRAEWQGWLEADPTMKADAEVAKQMMADAGYTGDPICGMPGAEPMFATVDGLKSISFEHSMKGTMPLSAIFLNKVREVKDAAARVAAAQAKATELSGEQGQVCGTEAKRVDVNAGHSEDNR